MIQNSHIRALWITFYLFVFILIANIHNASAGNTTVNPDSLKYLGHSFVKIKTSGGKIIYIDPFGVNEFADSADVVLITHEHSDHNDLTRVKQKAGCQVIRSSNAIQSGVYQTFTIGDIFVTAVAAYNSYHAKSACVGYVVEFDGIKLYHAGDTGKIPEMADLASMDITYALLPMDGVYTMSPEEATQAASMIQAKHDIPIHTMPPPDTYSDAIVARFTSPNKLIVRPGSSIELNNSTTSVEKSTMHPDGFRLEQNYPNPFNPITNIRFEIKEFELVTLKVYNILGREVVSLVSEELSPGTYIRHWDASTISSGTYFYRLQSGNLSETKRLLLMK